MSMIRQTVLIRTDLEFPTGLLTAQVAHIHALPLIGKLRSGNENVDCDFDDWTNTPYIFVHGVSNKETLDYLIKKAYEHDVPVLVWRDTVYLKVGDETVPFEKVVVGASLGPCDSDKIKMVIGTLDLLR